MILCIDGCSGSGKTTLAAALRQTLGWPVVHLDDFYPGWDGLAAASDIIVHQVLGQRRFQRWDWEANAPGQWVTVPAGDLIIEGAGSWTTAVAATLQDQPHVAVRLEAPAPVRKRRALTRDPFYAPYWQRWAAQEEAHFSAQPPVDLVLDSQDTAHAVQQICTLLGHPAC